MSILAKPAGEREFIALMAFLMSIVAISIDAMIPALGTIGADLGTTAPNQAQYIITAIFAGMTIGQLVCGPLSDAVGRHPVLFGGIVFYVAGTLLCLTAQTLPVMLFGRFLEGLGVSGPYVTCVSVVRDKFHGRQMARIMSLTMMIFIMVPAIAPTLGQGILYVASWRAIFALYIVYALAVTLWISLRLEETLQPEHRIPFNLKNIAHGGWRVLHNRATVAYMTCMGLAFGGFMGYLSSAQQIFQEHFGVGQYFGLCFGGLALCFGAASLVNARLVEKMGMRPLCRRAMVINIAVSAVFLLANFGLQPTLWMFLLYAAILFFNFGMIVGNLNALAMEPMGRIAGLASSVIGALSSVMSLTVGTLIGQMYNNSLVPLAAGFLVLGLLSLAAFYAAEPKRPHAA